MKLLRSKNTKNKGAMELFVYKDDDRFIGVNLTFDIVEEGNNPVDLMESIKEASMLHLDCVIKEDMSDELLNRYAPQEYWDKYFEVLEKAERGNENSYFQRSPYQMTQAVAMA